MHIEEAETLLADAELVVCLQAPLSDAKELRDACLDAEIPVVLDRGGCCGARGAGRCGGAPKLDLLARAPDAPRIAHLLQERWRALALREGTADDDHPALAAAAPPAAPAHPPARPGGRRAGRPRRPPLPRLRHRRAARRERLLRLRAAARLAKRQGIGCRLSSGQAYPASPGCCPPGFVHSTTSTPA